MTFLRCFSTWFVTYCVLFFHNVFFEISCLGSCSWSGSLSRWNVQRRKDKLYGRPSCPPHSSTKPWQSANFGRWKRCTKYSFMLRLESMKFKTYCLKCCRSCLTLIEFWNKCVTSPTWCVQVHGRDILASPSPTSSTSALVAQIWFDPTHLNNTCCFWNISCYYACNFLGSSHGDGSVEAVQCWWTSSSLRVKHRWNASCRNSQETWPKTNPLHYSLQSECRVTSLVEFPGY